ncbi:hypothetical protein CXG81DRAFT_6360, partial [Caulochytrium protostelioides]
ERNQDASVFVGNLDERVTDDLISELLTQAGPVVNVHLPKDRITGQHQGYGFVEFASEQDAEYAIRIMSLIKLYGRPLRINRASQDAPATLDVGATLFVGNLDPSTTDDDLQAAFSAFGHLIHPPRIARDPTTGESKGYGFVSYADFESSDAAIAAMDGQFLQNAALAVHYAYKRGPDGQTVTANGGGERHGSAAERLLAAQARLAQGAVRFVPNTRFAEVPVYQPASQPVVPVAPAMQVPPAPTGQP